MKRFFFALTLSKLVDINVSPPQAPKALPKPRYNAMKMAHMDE